MRMDSMRCSWASTRRSTNLRVGNATNGFKFDPKAATFPADATGAEYKQALRNAGVIA